MAKIPVRTIDANTGDFFKDFKDCIVKDNTGGPGVVSTGSISFDDATGIGGIPRGRITELFGMYSSSKTTLALHLIANAQKLGLSCVFIDNERSLSKSYAQLLGVNLKKLKTVEFDTLEQTLQAIFQFNCEPTNKDSVIVWDSIGLTPMHSELHSQIDKSHMGDRAQLLWVHSRRIAGPAKRNNILNLYLNQTTESFSPYEQFVTPGGHGLEHTTSMRVQVIRGQKQAIKVNNVAQEPWGVAINFTTNKNKCSVPHKKTQCILRFGVGYDSIYEVIERSINKKIIVQKGTWLSYEDKNIAQGKEKLRAKFEEDHKFFEKIKGLVT